MRGVIVAASVLLATLTTACGQDNATAPSTGLSVLLTDTPYSDAKALFVTFSTVSAHQTGRDFMPLSFAGGASTRTCDLKKLVGAQDVLGTGALPAGHYTELRVTVSSATIYFDNASSGPPCADTIASPLGRGAKVTIPSGEVKLNREFDVKASALTTITLDFDGDQSIHMTGEGRYMMDPVIGVLSVQ